jgi:hypothetical protein
MGNCTSTEIETTNPLTKAEEAECLRLLNQLDNTLECDLAKDYITNGYQQRHYPNFSGTKDALLNRIRESKLKQSESDMLSAFINKM